MGKLLVFAIAGLFVYVFVPSPFNAAALGVVAVAALASLLH